MSTPQYLTTGEVATELGIPRWRLAYLIERGELPSPSARVPGRRLFTDDDVTRIRRALAGQRPDRGRTSLPPSPTEGA